MLLKITLKCLSMRVALNFLNQVVNVDAMRSFHRWIRHSWDVEVDVLLVACTVELVVRVEWCNVTVFGRNKFFHCVCACARFHRFPCSIVNMHDAYVFRQFHSFPFFYLKNQVLRANVYHRSLVNGTFFLCHKTRFCVLRFPWSITDWIGFGLGWFGKLNTRCFSTRLLNEFTDWLLFNCRTQLIIPSGPIVIVFQWDLWWWPRRQVSFLVQDFSSFQSFNFLNAMSWKRPLKNNCIRSCLIEC